MTNIAYIGLDHHHCPAYLKSIAQLDAEVTCACEPSGDPTPADLDGVDDVAFYRDPDRLLAEEDVDLVWVTLSNRDTPAVLRSAVERDVDVFTEKPAARTATELESVAEAARDSSSTVGVSYTWRGHPVSRRLRDLADAGFFGAVDAFDARFVASALDARDTDHYLFDGPASRGGIVQWLGVHWLDLVPWMLDDPIVRVNARTSASTPTVDVEDGAALQIETESGAIGTLTCGYFLRQGRYDTHIAVYGDRGRSEWDPMGKTFGFDGETTLELDSADDGWASTPHRSETYEYDGTPGYGGKWGLEFFEEYFAARNGVCDPPATLEDALTVLRVLDATYESAETGEWTCVAGR
ncbi:gfo/Idh/MocA family oxidoreductase [halophilic archaeon]|nr:gfo/Idh/MocA family oxidoreductase [halophilic archaeon]